MSLLLKAKSDVVRHNKEQLQRWGNEITAKNFSAVVLISAHQDGKLKINCLDTIPKPLLISTLQTLINNLEK